MATLVSFHAHPDDECILCGGTLRKAADEGHRVVLVVATRGELGEVDDGFLSEGESLRDRRVREMQASAEILGAKRVEFLGYVDSGMMDEETNNAPARSGPRRSRRPRASWPPSSTRNRPTC
jgi:LmbE family N-acetylglucosaminyl deacetylase